jgi:hypothetical protein
VRWKLILADLLFCNLSIAMGKGLLSRLFASKSATSTLLTSAS